MILLFHLFQGTGWACDCGAPPTPRNELQVYDAVFLGTSHWKGESKLDPVEFQVEKAWKGVAGKIITVYGAAGDCSEIFDNNVSYLVYAFRLKKGKGYYTDHCARNSPAKFAEVEMKVLNWAVSGLTETEILKKLLDDWINREDSHIRYQAIILIHEMIAVHKVQVPTFKKPSQKTINALEDMARSNLYKVNSAANVILKLFKMK
ncbi:MAG: hypothetical protein GWN88_04610 [Nitrospinaceae bacterium]|nr:hypothetical protein [Nitrospinaceae bacterium]